MAGIERKAGAAEKGRMARLRVLLPLPLAGAYDYRVPAGWDPPEVGSFVEVPLGGRSAIGVVWDGEADPDLPERKLRDIQGVFDVPPMTASLRRFVEWVAAYTVSPPAPCSAWR